MINVFVRGPPSEIRTREIVRDIVDELKPYRSRLDRQQWQEDEVSTWLLEQVGLLRGAVPQHFTTNAIRRTVADARSIIKTTTMLQGQIKNARPELHLRWKSDLVAISDPSDKGKGVTIQTALLSTTSPRLSKLLAELSWLSNTCMESVYASVNRTDRCKWLCVDTAYLSIICFSQSPATIERLGPVAGSLYEAVTGIKDKDFRSLCQQKLKKLRS